MNFTYKIKCPHCNNNNNINLNDYIQDETSYEREMGPEIEYTIECEEFNCKKCDKKFKIEGSIWEYPAGAFNCDDIKTIIID